MLRRVVDQDLEPDPDGGGRRIRDGVAHERVISVGDPEMRHGRKSRTKTINGYKRHIIIADRMILGGAVEPANRAEDVPTGRLLDAARRHGVIRSAHFDRGHLRAPEIAAMWNDSRLSVRQEGVTKAGMRTPSILKRILSYEPSKPTSSDRSTAKNAGKSAEAAATAAPKPGSLASQIPPDWRKALEGEFEKPYFKELEKFVANERRAGSVLPPPEQVFAALARTPLKDVKAVLVGQDPYPSKGNANGLSFSVGDGQKIPGSLRNMFKTLHADVGVPMPKTGNLEPWADQGVLLLNTVLTVREGEANSHRNHGWEQFTNAIIDVVNKNPKPVAFMLLGKQAQEIGSRVTSKHTVVNAPHPSPVTPGNPFAKTRPFSEVNEALRKAGRQPIDWELKS